MGQKDEMAERYRWFSQIKYNKYKHQFRRMTEKQIIQKIINEWENITSQQMIKLEQYFNKPIKFQSEKKKKQIKQKIKNEEQSQQQSYIKQIKINEDSDYFHSELVHEQILDNDYDYDNNEEDEIKTKIIKKQIDYNKLKNKNYLIFFKYYYNKLNKQHPLWSNQQITIIIKLLWKKKKYQIKQEKKNKNKNSIKLENKDNNNFQKMTGNKIFKIILKNKSQGLNDNEIKIRWKQLPYESKKYWNMKGIKLLNIQNKLNQKINRIIFQGYKQNKKNNNNLKFMHKIIN